MENVKNIAIVGTQSQSGLLESVLHHRKFRIVYILEEETNSRLEELKQKYDLEYSIQVPYEEAELMLEDKTIEGVVISESLKERKKWILKCLKADKIVLCDGAFGNTLEDVQRCYEISKKVKKSLLGVNVLENCQPFQDIKKQLLSLQKISSLKKTTRSKKSKLGIINILTNDVQLICWIMDAYPEKVLCSADHKVLTEASTIIVTLRFPKELLVVTIQASLHDNYSEHHSVQICGDGKRIRSSTKNGGQLVKKVGANVTQKYSYQSEAQFDLSHQQALNQFLQLLSGSCNWNTEEEAERTLKISRILKSIDESLQKEHFVNIEE